MNRIRVRRLRRHGRLATAVLAASAVAAATMAGTPSAQAAETPLDSIVPAIYEPAKSVLRDVVGGLPTGDFLDLPGMPQGSVSRVEGADGIGEPGIGAQDFYPLERRTINDRMELDVNTSNGNVLVRYRDMTLKSLGLNLSVSHVYNNISTGQGSFGRGWTMTSGRDINLEVASDKVTLHGPTGYEAEFEREGDGFTSPSGIDADLTRTDGGRYELEFDDSEESGESKNPGETWEFSAGGHLLKQADKNDNEMTFHYNANNTLASIKDTSGRVTRMSQYDAGGRVVRFQDPTGASYGPFQYDSKANLMSFTDRGGKDVRMEYDEAGNLTKITDPRGAEYTMAYDSKKRIVSLSEPTSDRSKPAITRYSYGDRKTEVTDALGGTSKLEFDEDGRQTDAMDQLGHERSQEWTTNSDVQSTTSSLSNSVSYDYDANNNLIGSELPTGAKSGMGYTDANNPALPTAFTDPEGRKLSRDYDDDGNLTKVRSDGLGKDLFNIKYNDNGTVKEVKDGDGRVSTFEYDDIGQLVASRPPAPRKETRYEYDTLGRTIAIEDGRGTRLEYRYDAFDRVVEIVQDKAGVDTPLQRQSYDANGNRDASATATALVSYRFEPRNQVTKVDTTRGSTPAETVSYTYDPVLNVASLTDPGGTVRYGYDKAFRLTTMRDAGSRTTYFAYDDDNNRTYTYFPNKVLVKSDYDKSSRVTKMVATLPNGSKTVDRTYSWKSNGEANGKDTSLLQKQTQEGTSIDYDYDGLMRLTKAGSQRYSYDVATNVTAAEGRSYGRNSAGQVTSVSDGQTFGHDGAGNLATGNYFSADYSPTSQLLKQSFANGALSNTFSYDTSDQTQRATITTSSQGRTVQTQTMTNSALGVTGVTLNGFRDGYVRDPDGVLLQQNPAGSTPLHAITDYQGSVLRLTGSDGSVKASYGYTAYGTTKKSDGNPAERNPFRWQGQFQVTDAQGTYLQGTRNMSPYLARFTQTDFSGEEANPYALGFGNPVEFVDPSGTLSCGQKIGLAVSVAFFAAAIAVVGGAATAVLAAGSFAAAAVAPAGFGAAYVAGASSLATGALSVGVAALNC